VNSRTVSLAVLLTTSFMLMLTASYLSNVQNWLKFNQSNSQSYLNQGVSLSESSGIRVISSISTPKIISPPPHESTYQHDVTTVNRVSKFESLPQVSDASLIENTDPLLNKGGEKKKQQLLSPDFIQYNDALVIEVPKILATQRNLKRMIYRVLLSPSAITGEDLLSTEPIKTQHKPWFYRQVLNQHGQAIRYPAAASEYANYLLQAHTQEVTDREGSFVLIQIPRVENRILTKIERYKPWVEQYARQFKVSQDLVFAIIEVESAFKPRAISKSNALGLMQIKAHTAGRDVYQYVDGRAGQPTQEALFDAQTNLRTGIAYMGLLKHEYLLGVRNPKIKEMLAISSYNAGISRTLKLFADTPEAAISRVNQLHPKRVYRTLRYEHASSEARQYLDKVLSAKKRYSDLLS